MNLFVQLPSDGVLRPNYIRMHGTHVSDSVLLFTESDTVEDLHSILYSSSLFFAKALQKCVPLRGGISYGEIYINLKKYLFAGVPIITACELAENAHWSGIIVDQSVTERYRENPINSGGREVIVKWDVCIKGQDTKKNITHWVLNWPWDQRNNWKVETPISSELYSKAFESLFGGSYKDWPEYVREKYDNTIASVNTSLGRNMK